MTTLASIGENALLRELLPRLAQQAGTVAGPGDDCAILRLPGARDDLPLTTDPAIEPRHFLPGTPPRHIGRKAIAMGERLVEMIPVAKTVYSASKQVIQLISRDTEETPRTTALVDFPAPGIKAFGFVTGRIRMPDGRLWIKVFIPTTPNPTTGFLQIVPEERCTLLDMSTEDTFGVIMSAGVLAPPDLTPHILSHAPTPPADDAPRDDGPAPDMELLNP